MPFVYRAPSFRAWIQRVRRGRGPVTPILKPHCDFAITPPPPTTAPVLVRFVSLSFLFGPPTFSLSPPRAGKPTSFTWDFGDGSPIETDENVIHTYNDPGSFTVTHTATNSAGTDICVKVNFIVLALLRGSVIRRLDSSDRTTARIVSADRVTARLRVRQTVVVSGLTSKTAARIRRLNSDDRTSVTLRTPNA